MVEGTQKKCLMQAFDRNKMSVPRFRFASDGIFDRFRAFVAT